MIFRKPRYRTFWKPRLPQAELEHGLLTSRGETMATDDAARERALDFLGKRVVNYNIR
jgi:hypothetical protein